MIKPFQAGAGEGTLLEVRVVPGAKRSGITGTDDGRLRVRVQAPPVEGKANLALLNLLARELGMKKNRLKLVSGGRSRNKTVLLKGVKPALARAMIQTVLERE